MSPKHKVTPHDNVTPGRFMTGLVEAYRKVSPS